MAVLAGIDEAGLGPTLGPLVVSGVAFSVPDDALDKCLWTTLRASCASKPSRSERRLVIADSKQLYKPKGGLAPLERAALVMLAVSGHRPKSWRELMKIVAPEAPELLDQYAWYANSDIALPIDGDPDAISTRANAVSRDMNEHGVEFGGAFCELLPEGHFNRLIKTTRNKSVVLLGMVLRVMDRILRSAPNQRVRFLIDRLGGRTHYRDVLMTAMPDYELTVREESDRHSVYRMTNSSRRCEIAFVTKGDRRHFPIALASVYSKYHRELAMHRFNAYWSAAIANLRPTAGYYQDAKRWLSDASDELARRSIQREDLVRSR